MKFDLICLEDATIACCKEVVVVKSWFDYLEESNMGSKADSYLVICNCFPSGETYQL